MRLEFTMGTRLIAGEKGGKGDRLVFWRGWLWILAPKMG